METAASGWVQTVDIGGGVEEAFCAEEEACAGTLIEGETEGPGQGVGGVILDCGVVLIVAVTAFGAEAVVGCDGFEKSGFSGAILAGEEDDT